MPDNDSLAEDLAALSVRGLCMVSPLCRSVSDIVKLTRNVEANLAVHCLVLTGGEEGKAYPAMEALTAIFGGNEEASDKAAALAHAVRGKLKSLDFAALEKRVRVVDMLGCVEVDKIIAGVNKLGAEAIRPNTGFLVQSYDTTLGVERVIAPTNISYDLQTDKAGRYVIGTQKKSIVIEHYNSKGELLRLIEGTTARDLCITLIRNGWVSKLDHAAYLGRELTLAELAISQGIPYEQDGQATAAEDSINGGAKK
jgi:tetrahydromethanopterin S-methyltransferase subunit A